MFIGLDHQIKYKKWEPSFILFNCNILMLSLQ